MQKAPFIFFIFIIVNFSCHSKSGNRNLNNGNIQQTKVERQNYDIGYIQVTKIVDGDTFWADDGTTKGIKIRLIGVDAPESRKTGNKEIGYYGIEAKQYLTNLLSGKKVKLEYDVGRYDQYHRTLAYVYLENGTFINAELVKQGYAMVMTVPPNVKYAEIFVKLQQEARESNRGLWKESK